MDSRHTHKQIGTINTADGSRNVICFVGHCTHQIQPVGVAFMGPLNNYYSRDVKTWLRNNTGREVTQLTCLCSGSNPERRTFCVYTHRNLSRRHQSCCDTNFLESETTQWPTLSPPPQLGTLLSDQPIAESTTSTNIAINCSLTQAKSKYFPLFFHCKCCVECACTPQLYSFHS